VKDYMFPRKAYKMRAAGTICKVCQSKNIHHFCEKNGYMILRCNSCGLAFVNQNVTAKEILHYYSSKYNYEYPSIWGDASRHALARYKLLKNTSDKEKGFLLDVGCSFGHFLTVAKQHGWVVKGIEIDHNCVIYAQQKFGLDVFAGTLEQAHFGDSTFDVITLFHVLEHITNPQRMLLDFFEILKPDGILLLLTPNIDSLHFRILKTFHPWLSPPAHLFYFSQKSLELLLKRSGFVIRSMKTCKVDADNLFTEILVELGKRFLSLSQPSAKIISKHAGITRVFRVLRKITDTILGPFDNLDAEIFVVAQKISG